MFCDNVGQGCMLSVGGEIYWATDDNCGINYTRFYNGVQVTLCDKYFYGFIPVYLSYVLKLKQSERFRSYARST